MLFKSSVALSLAAAPAVIAQGFPAMCPPVQNNTGNATIGTCPQDFTVIGPTVEPVHESSTPPTGLMVDPQHNIYITYPRNNGATQYSLTIATSFYDEEPWPNNAVQNCSSGQDPSTCFINCQNAVLDSAGYMWTVDSGIPTGQSQAIVGGAKVQKWNITQKKLLQTWAAPASLLQNRTNLNDLRVNTTSGPAGHVFMTDISGASLITLDLSNNQWSRRLYKTPYTSGDPGYVGVFDGTPYYSWNGTQKSFVTTGADGIALQSGNVYWGVWASQRFYYLPQAALTNFSMSEADVEKAVVFPGEMGSEQAGFTADDKGRVYMLASEQNAIFYVETQQQYVQDVVNGVGPGGSGPVAPENYWVKTLVRNALIQHADSAAILDGYLYFCTNQLELQPKFQYMNKDNRRGPWRTYRTFIGRGPVPA